MTLKAYELLNEGRALLRQGRKEQTFAKIQAANELNGNTALGFALGVCGAIELEPKDTADREMRAAIDDDVLDLIVELLGSDALETAEKMKAKLRQQRGA